MSYGTFLHIETQGITELARNFKDGAAKWEKIVYPELKQLGHALTTYMRYELKPRTYTGELARSISSRIEIRPTGFTLTTGPNAKHTPYLYHGTRRHWVPLAPLQRWVSWKIAGADEKTVYKIRASIHKYGTSMWSLKHYGKKGDDWDVRTMKRGDTARSMETFTIRVVKRVGAEIMRATGAK